MEVLPDSDSFLPQGFPLGTWRGFEAIDKAVLTFVQDGDQLLLMHKKRGLGAGKVNAPGGRLEAGETYLDAAIRECLEEVLVTPLQPRKVGELHFRFSNGHSIYGEVFWSRAYKGVPGPSEEADPFWCPIREIPWEKMWQDDQVWLPLAIAGHRFRAFFDFDEDKMLAGSLSFQSGFRDVSHQ